jgi:protein TonB
MRATAFALALILLGSSQIEGANPRGFSSDAELRQAMIGTWEIGMPRKLGDAITKSVVVYHNDGRFDQVSIAEVGRENSRIDDHGTWQIENGTLVETATSRKDSALTDLTQRHAVLSATGDRISLQARGFTVEMQRAQWPKNLPPVSPLLTELVESARLRHAYAVETPQPWYPYLARKNGQQGRGIFRLMVNPNGSVRSVEIVQSTRNDSLDGAVLKGLQQWRFKPGKVTTLLVPVIFVMPRS